MFKESDWILSWVYSPLHFNSLDSVFFFLLNSTQVEFDFCDSPEKKGIQMGEKHVEKEDAMQCKRDVCWAFWQREMFPAGNTPTVSEDKQTALNLYITLTLHCFSW